MNIKTQPLHSSLSRAAAQLAFCLLLTLVVAMPATADVNRSFDVKPGGTLRVDADLGSIEVRTADRSEVEVKVEISGPNEDDVEIDIDNRGGDVSVRADYDRGTFGFFGRRSPRVRFKITVPRQFDAELETSGGSISIDDLEGRVQAKTSGGSLSFGQIDGTVDGRTSGGSISLKGSSGDADLHTSGGSITVGDVDGSVEAHTSGGSISLRQIRGRVVAETSGGSVRATLLEQPTGDCRLETSGGSVTVELAEGLGFELDASSSGGRVSSDFKVSGGVQKRTSVRGEIGGGGPELRLRSSGGGVRVLRH